MGLKYFIWFVSPLWVSTMTCICGAIEKQSIFRKSWVTLMDIFWVVSHQPAIEISLVQFLDVFSHLYKRVCPSVCRSVRRSHTNWISEKWSKSNKIASGTRKSYLKEYSNKSTREVPENASVNQTLFDLFLDHKIWTGFWSSDFLNCFWPILAWHIYVKTAHWDNASSILSWKDVNPFQYCHFKLNYSSQALGASSQASGAISLASGSSS